jgi:thiamine biosynthesis protein ThiC
MEITQARRTLNWEKQISLSINPEEAERIQTRREGQVQGNNALVLCVVQHVCILCYHSREFSMVLSFD